MRLSISWQEVEDALPGFKQVWKEIKKDTGTRIRSPKSVNVTDEPSGMFPDDRSCCRRYALDLENMMLKGRVHVSAGEWACTPGNPDDEVKGVPNAAALVSCEWNDHYRMFLITVQVKEGSIQTMRLKS
jgi:hypothetical protein